MIRIDYNLQKQVEHIRRHNAMKRADVLRNCAAENTFPPEREVPGAINPNPLIVELDIQKLRSGVYFLCSMGTLMYIGQSTGILARVCSHLKAKWYGSLVDAVFYIPVAKKDLDELERLLIMILKPENNKTKYPNHQAVKVEV